MYLGSTVEVCSSKNVLWHWESMIVDMWGTKRSTVVAHPLVHVRCCIRCPRVLARSLRCMLVDHTMYSGTHKATLTVYWTQSFPMVVNAICFLSAGGLVTNALCLYLLEVLSMNCKELALPLPFGYVLGIAYWIIDMITATDSYRSHRGLVLSNT